MGKILGVWVDVSLWGLDAVASNSEGVLDWCGIPASAADVGVRENLSLMLLRGWSVNVLAVLAVGNMSGFRVVTLLLEDATSERGGVAGFLTVNALSDPGTLVSLVLMAVKVDVSSALNPVRLKAGIAELPQSHCGCSVQFPDS